MKEKLDVKYKNGDLSSELSNLYPHQFSLDGYVFASMEGFLQSLKTAHLSKKIPIFETYGYGAWKCGQSLDWQTKQELYWIETPIDRHSKIYTALLCRAYDALFEQNSDYKNALERSLDYKLDHSIGQLDTDKTIMTKKEFLYQLNRQRNKLKNKLFDLSSIFKF